MKYIKHPFYDMDSVKAMALATRLLPENDILPSPKDHIPNLDQAIDLIHSEFLRCGFNRVALMAAEEVLLMVKADLSIFGIKAPLLVQNPCPS